MKTQVARSGAGLGWPDYLLTAIGSMLAVYSAGMSIQVPEIGLFCGALIAVGTLCSYAVKLYAGSSKMIRLDGPTYALAAICAIFFAPSLMTILPTGGFPAQMAAAGGLCWMLVFGSFLSWNDSTLLFQAVPSIALFGLVGCYDTWRNVVWAFFAFLICLCTGFARAHFRDMLRRAAESGYFDRAGIRFDPQAPEQSAELYDSIKKGPWRWIAGPEWAFASAFAIVMISLLGAPVIQSSVQGVAGFASIHLPNTRRNGPTPPSIAADTSATTLIGQGPVPAWAGVPIYEVKMDRVRYLRSHWYVNYIGRGWAGAETESGDELTRLCDFSVQSLKEAARIDFQESPQVVTRNFALPGEFEATDITDAHLTINDGTYVSPEPVDVGHFITGTSMEARDPDAGVTAIHPTPDILTPFTGVQNADQRVLQLADDVTKDCKNDRERAVAIMKAITDHAQYNANIPPTPNGSDPVAYFLFESHQGYCDVFASAMTLMAREAHIPARYVTGYLPDAQTDIDGSYIVRDRDFHAWSELFFQDVGWVVFDPTTMATVAPGGEVRMQGDNAGAFSLLSVLLDGAIGALVLGGGWLLWRSRKKDLKTPAGRRTEVEQMYVSFARMLRSFTGRRRLLCETPDEYLAQTQPALNGAFSHAESLTRKFEAALYSPALADGQTIAGLEKDLKTMKMLLRQEKKAKRSGARPSR